MNEQDAARVAPWARVVNLVVALIAAIGLSLYSTGSVIPTSSRDALIFQSTLLFVVLGSAVLEHKFTRPADSVVNGLMGMVSLVTVANVAPQAAWWAVVTYCGVAFAARSNLYRRQHRSRSHWVAPAGTVSIALAV